MCSIFDRDLDSLIVCAQKEGVLRPYSNGVVREGGMIDCLVDTEVIEVVCVDFDRVLLGSDLLACIETDAASLEIHEHTGELPLLLALGGALAKLLEALFGFFSQLAHLELLA